MSCKTKINPAKEYYGGASGTYCMDCVLSNNAPSNVKVLHEERATRVANSKPRVKVQKRVTGRKKMGIKFSPRTRGYIDELATKYNSSASYACSYAIWFTHKHKIGKRKTALVNKE